MGRQIAVALLLALGSLALGSQAVGQAELPAGVLEAEFIYEDAAFPQCHASTIAQSEGVLVAAWFGGTREKHPDVGIWSARRVAGKWTAPVELANGVQYRQADGTTHRHPCWNPVLFQPSKGPLMLFYKVGPDPRSWWGMLMTSDDGGMTWSLPRRLPEQIDGPVKNKPVELADGSILCGSSTEYDGWRVHFERTADLARTWVRSGPVNDGRGVAAIQPSILSLGGQRLLALGRSRQGKVYQVQSEDLGKTWGGMKLTDLPNPNAGTDAVTLREGRHLLVYNHTARGRTPLNVALSSDGQRWEAAVVLEDQPGEYSYPAVIQTADGLVHVTYTWKRQRIKHVVLDPARLKTRPIVKGEWPE